MNENDQERTESAPISETTTTYVYEYEETDSQRTIEILTAGRTEVLGVWIR